MDDMRGASEELRTQILATNVSRGGITAFGERGITFLPSNLSSTAEPVDAGLLRVSKAVAASSAFPAMFPPLALGPADVGADDAVFRSQWFTDAGVSNNLAFDTLVRTQKDLDLIVVSDAGRSNISPREQSFGVLTNALRSSDLMLFRISELARERARSFQGPRVAILSIADVTEGVPGQSPAVIQRPLERIRTDFDRFSAVGIEELVKHGWCVARSQLTGVGTPPTTQAPSSGRKRRGSPSRVAEQLEAGSFRRVKLLAADDWLSWVYGALLVAVLLVVGTAVPRLTAVATNYINLARASRVLTPDVPQWLSGPVPATALVEKLPPDTNDDFTLVAEDRVWDLRLLTPETDPSNPNSLFMRGSAYLLRSALLSLPPDKPTTYLFKFLTSGTELKAWRVGGDAIRIFGLRNPELSGPSSLRSFIVETDVSETLTRGEPVQVHAQIIDAFKDRNNWWAGMRVTRPVQRISMRIVFPRARPFKKGSIRFEKYRNETVSTAESFDGIVVNKEEGELLWYVDKPSDGYTYRVSWDW